MSLQYILYVRIPSLYSVYAYIVYDLYGIFETGVDWDRENIFLYSVSIVYSIFILV